jgi:hypothetical protein
MGLHSYTALFLGFYYGRRKGEGCEKSVRLWGWSFLSLDCNHYSFIMVLRGKLGEREFE